MNYTTQMLNTYIAQLFAVGCMVVVTSCSNPDKAFKNAEVRNTKEGYEAFAKEYPASKLATVALQRVDDIAFGDAKSMKGWRSLRDYLSGKGQHRHENEARSLCALVASCDTRRAYWRSASDREPRTT